MGTRDIIVDGNGRVRATSDISVYGFPADLDHRHGDVPDYLVRNMGCVRVRWSDKSANKASVSFQLGTVSSLTVRSLAEFLLERDFQYFVVRLVGEDVVHQLFESIDELIFLLVEQSVGGAMQRPRHFVQPLDLDRLGTEVRFGGLRQRYRSWSRTGGRLVDHKDGRGLIKQEGLEYAVRVKGDRVTFAELGTASNAYGTSEGRFVGQDVPNQPDADYGAWIADSLSRVSRNEAPVLQVVEATIAPPGSTPTRYRYERLMLPWLAGQERIVSVISLMRAITPSASSR